MLWAREVCCTFLGGISNQSSPLVSYLLCNKSSPMGPTAQSYVLDEERRSSQFQFKLPLRGVQVKLEEFKIETNSSRKSINRGLPPSGRPCFP